MPRAALPTLLLLLAAALALPSPAAAADPPTLSTFEEPVGGENLVIDFRVTPEEAGKPGIVVFLNPPSQGFGLVVYRADGSTAYERNGTRGVQPFPALQEGPHKVFIRGNGIFQITPRYLDRLGGSPQVTEVDGTLSGADAYVLAPTRGWEMRVEGNVTAEWRELGGATRTLPLPANVTVAQGAAYVLTLRGAEGSEYRIRLVPVGPDPTPATPGNGGAPTASADQEKGTPGAGAALLLAGAGLVALGRRRRGAP